MSISLLHSPLNISETIVIKASFQTTTGRKWPMTNQMVTWPSCIVQLVDDRQSWAVIRRLLTHKDKNFLAVYLQILNWLQSWRLFIRRWSQCWYWVAWTTGTPPWSESRLPCVVTSNLCSTPLHDPSLVFGAQTTSLRRSPAFTGCAHLSAYNSSWWCWSSDRCMDWLHSIWLTTLSAWLTCLADIGFDQRGHIDWTPVTRGTESVACNHRWPNIPCGWFQTLERPAQRCRRLPDCWYIPSLAEIFLF